MSDKQKAPTRRQSGTFTLGGDLTVNRLGFGAMRITGEGIWGDPKDPDGVPSACCAAPSNSAST